MSPEERVNYLLPFLDPQLAACVLMWLQKEQGCGGAALRQLLEAYPVEWAYEELGWEAPASGFMSVEYAKASAAAPGEEAAWAALLEACVTLRSEAAASGYDFSKVPARVMELRETLEGKLLLSRGARNDAKVKDAVFSIAWLAHMVFWIVLRLKKVHSGEVINATNKKSTAKPSNLSESGWSDVVDYLFSERVLQAVVLVAPHLLRYYVALVLPLRKRGDNTRAIVHAIATVKHQYSDPLTRFTCSIFQELNLPAAQAELAHFEASMAEDYLLCGLAGSIGDTARLLVFEHYCRIHMRLNADKIAALCSDERKIVNLIKEAKVDAKIRDDVIEIANTSVNAYSSILDRTRSLLERTQALVQSCD